MTQGLSKVTVLTSCTGLKQQTSVPVPAEELYAGQHHLRLMRGVEALRSTGATVDVWIVSAGHGIVHGKQSLLPYEQTFQGRPAAQRRHMARVLEIPAGAERVLSESADLAVVALGEEYLEACKLRSDLRPAARIILMCSASAALNLPHLENTRVVPLRTQQTREFSCGFVGLKGEVTGRLLFALAHGRLQLEDLSDTKLLSALSNTGSPGVSTAATLF